MVVTGTRVVNPVSPQEKTGVSVELILLLFSAKVREDRVNERPGVDGPSACKLFLVPPTPRPLPTTGSVPVVLGGSPEPAIDCGREWTSRSTPVETGRVEDRYGSSRYRQSPSGPTIA